MELTPSKARSRTCAVHGSKECQRYPKNNRLVVTGDTELDTTVVELEHQILAGMSP
ncbi:hypothetical protein PISMIDRAFT_689038 [Pisolithus microcarpus 441]|uniref:Uncharacterized protein n=1 Tax=Pisolithus microcarpus 441 TaxID=765257 RepID=A0A0C9YYU1_9AGAM|nr:hypothetical protein PISMIDRAFT_689038 [Pisolithus microcarpus 441]